MTRTTELLKEIESWEEKILKNMKKENITFEDKLFIKYSFKILKDIITKIKGRELTKRETSKLIKDFAKKISKQSAGVGK